MRRMITLIAVVGFGIVFVQPASFSHEGHSHRPPQSDEKANVEQKETEEAALNPDEAPDIVFESYDHDFGTIYAGEKAEHLFKFENHGKSDLVIERVQTSCGCTAAATTKGTIPPGGSGEIKATFKAGQSPGQIRKIITVVSNDPTKKKINLGIQANVIKEIITKPQWINFGNVTKGEVCTRTVELRPGTDDFNLDIAGVESDSPHVTATYKKHENGRSYVVDISTRGDAEIGRIKGKIIITNNSTRQKKITIPFSGKITGDVLVSRPVLSYGKVPQGNEPVRKLIVTLKKKDIDIKDLEITPTFLSANIRPKTNPDLPYREVEVRLKNDAPLGEINGNIKIHTSSKLQPVIEIPVFGTVIKRVTKKS